MDSAETVPNDTLGSRKHGLSSWVKFGRLTDTTNFEEYGASPPEANSEFLCDYYRIKHDNVDVKENFVTASAEEYPIQKTDGGSFSNSFLYDPQLSNRNEQIHSPLPVPALSSLLLECLTDDTSSSTDTTPFVTPQGSPLIARRNIIESMHNSLAKDLAAQNTKKWLYKGFVADGNEVKIQTCIPKKRIKQPGNISPTSNGKRCNISNFDINALSPSSW